jgi:hypothetical protein
MALFFSYYGGSSQAQQKSLSHHELEERRAEVHAFERAVAEAILLASGLNVRPGLGLRPKRGRMFHV